MPQMNKGGKFIFGRSLIRENGLLQLPPQAVQEYGAKGPLLERAERYEGDIPAY